MSRRINRSIAYFILLGWAALLAACALSTTMMGLLRDW